MNSGGDGGKKTLYPMKKTLYPMKVKAPRLNGYLQIF